MMDDEFLGLPKILEMEAPAIPLLQQILQDQNLDSFLHQRALICLGEIGAEEGFNTAAFYLDHPNPIFRIAAARAIVKINPAHAADLLIDELDDDDISACKVKIQCLAASGQSKAKSALNKLKKNNKEPFLRKAATLAVKHLNQGSKA